jgi:predicted metal-dependent phosphoesterase TrpH
MKIDLHIHTRTGSDGNLPVEAVFKEAGKRNIDLISVTDHDSLKAQARAISLARKYGMAYIPGVELNVTFSYPGSKSVSLDFLGYGYDISNQALNNKLRLMREHREARARQILEKLNTEFEKENIPRFTAADLEKMQARADGSLGRPHIAD